MEKKKERQSNIELLRMLTMIGVIALHYNNPTIGGGIAYAKGINLNALYIVESLFVCAVDLFILITGYFMCINSKRTLLKPLQLLIQVMIFSFLTYLLRVVFGSADFSITNLIKSLIPANYFVILYVTLYFVSPYINIALDHLNSAQLKKMLIVLVVLFSVWPTLVDFSGELIGTEWIGLSTVGMYGSQWGYSIINFSLLYMVGAYLRKTENVKKRELSSSILVVMLLGCVIFLVIWAKVNDVTGFQIERSAWEYCNPIVIIEAALLFKIFKRMSIKENRVINELAKGAFTVFLLQNEFVKMLHVEEYVKSNIVLMLLHLIISTVGIYLVCWIIYKIYDLVTTPVYKILYNHSKIVTNDLYK